MPCSYIANRCKSCGTVGIFDIDDGEKPSLRLCTTSRMIPGADHPVPFNNNLTFVWATLFRYRPDEKRKNLCWLRVAFADSIWKTYEKDIEDLTIEEGYRAFYEVSRQISNLVTEPSFDDLFCNNFGFG
jgi:hypothetical protein